MAPPAGPGKRPYRPEYRNTASARVMEQAAAAAAALAAWHTGDAPAWKGRHVRA